LDEYILRRATITLGVMLTQHESGNLNTTPGIRQADVFQE